MELALHTNYILTPKCMYSYSKYIKVKHIETFEPKSNEVVKMTRRLMNQSSLGQTKLSRYRRISLFEMSGALFSSFLDPGDVEKTLDSTTAFFQNCWKEKKKLPSIKYHYIFLIIAIFQLLCILMQPMSARIIMILMKSVWMMWFYLAHTQ